MKDFILTDADRKIQECISSSRSFSLVAGAGAGKTTSLIRALDFVRERHGRSLKQNAQRIACITYTNRAVEVIRSRLGFDGLYHVRTLHGFLWGEMCRFQKDLKESLMEYRIPSRIDKAREKDSSKNTQEARKARKQVHELENSLEMLHKVPVITYGEGVYSDYGIGQLGHDDIVEIAGWLMRERPRFRRLLGLRYPFIFVDEAQDTHGCIVDGLNEMCSADGLPMVGYFGDPWQQIYDGRAGSFSPPVTGVCITKHENFRCAPQVITFLNAFRTDVKQVPGVINRDLLGSVEIRLVRAEKPQGARNRYSEPQVERALKTMDRAVDYWGWSEEKDVVRLFLVRQMIAKRLGFPELQNLFTGLFASKAAQDAYGSGEHFALKPFIRTVFPLVSADWSYVGRRIVDILRRDSPAYSVSGVNATNRLKDVVAPAKSQVAALAELFETGTVKDVLSHGRDTGLLELSPKLLEHMARRPRDEEYDEDLHSEDKGDWLMDSLFAMPANQVRGYCEFHLANTAYSTQHGVKGEEYRKVVVVFDDVEAAWHDYSFGKLLTPDTVGKPTEGQLERSRKLAYVCFSRAREHLRVLLFTPQPEEARTELINKLNMKPEQISIA